jgi:Mlc titration factor MtfA (ptsG expression regulator)
VAQLSARDVPLSLRLFDWLRRRPAPLLPEPGWRTALAATPWAKALSSDDAKRLRALTEQFLREKTITPLDGLVLDENQRTQLALLCCLPLLRYGQNGMDGWSQLLVYPGAFQVRRRQVDAAGVLHEWDDGLIGESWGSGPLILSWADVQADLRNPWAGHCVAVHEMAHKLEALDGTMDGTPLLPREWQREWARDFQHSYDAFCAQVAAGQHTGINPYAAESPAEFFAVLSEYHFSAPGVLHRTMPAVAAHLQRFYGPSPARAS